MENKKKVMFDYSQEYEQRCAKVERLKALGKDPWYQQYDVNSVSCSVFDAFEREGETSKIYRLAGRIRAIREHGKTIFVVIQDRVGTIQLYLNQQNVGEEQFSLFKETVDLGDIVGCTGTAFRTKMGEVTLKVQSYLMLSKCLHPLPEKFHGLVDIETVYRQRYLDLISNQESKQRFLIRSHIIRSIRSFLDEQEFIEVETPMLHPIPGGAAARPFVTHHNALDMDLYLRIAPELYLKRLVVGGFDRVYEINRNFRNEGISTRHNPEFTMLEFYIAYKNCGDAMDLLESMIRSLVLNIHPTLCVSFGEHELSFEEPFKRLSMKEAVKHFMSLSDEALSEESIDDTLQTYSLTHKAKGLPWGNKLYLLFEQFVEDSLIQPTFITDFPVSVSPLAKRVNKTSSYASRFELFIGGIEISNGFNELNDPFEQADRFKEQLVLREKGDSEAHYYDDEYIGALQYGLPPTAGVGVGIDRLTMLLTHTTSIKDVILFPTLRKK
ncbi:MAG: lysine--tRNA ligase [Candidatus Babeliales bacterium]